MNTKTTPKDFFLHLGATIALYASAIALMNLAFTVVDRIWPDALANYWTPSAVVWPISMLLVLVPVLYVIEWLLTRDISRLPEKKDVWIRRWRLYLTLFLTGATIAGDLIALINTYLGGEITTRFVAKVLIVLVVSAIIFAFYLLERLSDSKPVGKWPAMISWLGLAVILASIVAGFIFVGSPAKQRSIRFDEQRINDLSSIQWQIVNYWQAHGRVPLKLADLNDTLGGFTVPTDPETGDPYQLQTSVPDPLHSFSLCATFDLPSSDPGEASLNSYPAQPYVDSLSGNWDHTAGLTCLDRTIDPSRYPVNPSASKIVPM